MALAFVGSASGEAINGGNATVTFPGGVAEGDLVVLAYTIGTADEDPDPGTSLTDETGWTQTVDIRAVDAVSAANLAVFHKIMGATPDSSATGVGSGGASDGTAIAVHVWSGADTTTPMDATPTSATIATPPPDPPSITTVTADAVVLAIGCHTVGDDTITAPTNYGNLVTNGVMAEVFDGCIVIASRLISSAGPEDPGAFQDWTTNANHATAAATVAIRPAGGGGGLTIPIIYPHYMKLWAA